MRQILNFDTDTDITHAARLQHALDEARSSHSSLLDMDRAEDLSDEGAELCATLNAHIQTLGDALRHLMPRIVN